MRAVTLQDNLEAAYRDVRQNLKEAQHCQKGAYNKGVRHMSIQADGLMLCYNPQLKPGEASKFHCHRVGPYVIVK